MEEQQNVIIENKCSVCENEFEDEYFDIAQNKCILHCDKDDWYETTLDGKNWSKSYDRIELFWQKVRKIIQSRESNDEYREGYSLDFSQTIFPKFEDQYTEEEQFDDETIDIIDWHDNFCNTFIAQSSSPSLQLDVRLDFSNSIFLDNADFNFYEFQEFVLFNNVQFKGECSFYNTTFSSVTFNNVNFFKSARFEKAKVNLSSYRSGDFENTIFHDNAEFYECIFGTEDSKKDFDIDFKGTQFKKVHILSCTFHNGLRFFKDVKVKYIDLQNMNLQELYIASDTENIHIRGNNKEIDKLTIKHKNLKNLMIHNCIVKSSFLLNDKIWKKDDVFKIDQLNFSESTFLAKVKIQFYEITGTANFYNTKFKDLADFYRTKFNEVLFERTDFEKVAVFSEAIFNQDVNFKYAKFLGYSVFRDTVIKGKLDLRNTIFDTDADANFLDITSEERAKDDKTNEYYGEPKVIQVANRETAKIIKSFYEYSNNIIEANKFYALEMKEREKELNRDIKIGKNILEWLVFKIHSISSDHSQSWFLSLFWIIYFTFMFSFLNNFHKNNTQFLSSITTLIYFEISFIIGLLIDSLKNKGRVLNGIIIALVSYFIYGLHSNDFALNCFSKNINPFSIMKGSDNITFGELIFKITTAYLIYQFIISVRQNTRRK